MLVNCNSCQKKFSVPDAAITEIGRLLQCGSCGNEWTQYPVKEELKKEISKVTPIRIESSAKVNRKKTLKIKKKRAINLYSEEYLKKKHALEIKDTPGYKKKNKDKKTTAGFSFLSYLIIATVFVITLLGVLNITKDFIIINYPFTEAYISYLYETFETIRMIIFSFIN
jgi:predicted Zn finger-like uncharacterized protein